MKYWIFQNNQVLGPYEPDEMGKISVFSPESLVCPEGRRGTSMGDWQRAGMVPDLSVALVRATSSGMSRTSVLSIAGLPPEPTLKDLAQLGSIQEKVAMLEEVVIQLQEGLRAKDEELTSVHQELAGKSREAGEIKNEAAARQREADELKRQIAGLEDRLASVRVLSDTLDKAVEEERRVGQDVEKQGQTLTDLAKDVEELRRQLEESKARQAELSAAAEAAAAAAPPPPAPFHVPAPEPASARIPAPPEFSKPPEPSSAFEPSPYPETKHEAVDMFPPPPSEIFPPAQASHAPVPVNTEPVEFPTINAAPLQPLDASLPSMSSGPAVPTPFGDDAGSLAPDTSSSTNLASPPEPKKSRKGLLIGAAAGIAALCGLAVMGGFVPGLVKPKAPAVVLEPAPLPPPEPTPLPVAPDPRTLAVEFAKAWPLPGKRTLESALEDLAPSAGNLSPWMADPLAGGRVQVNYFARSSAPGAPTIAYEFEVDLDGKTLVGRNAAAKSVLTGKAAAPPAPPKAKVVKVRPKAAPKKKAPEEDTLDSMLGGSAGRPAETTTDTGLGETTTDTGLSGLPMPGGMTETPREALPLPGETQSADAPAARPNPAKRAAKAKAGKAKPKASEKSASDETLLDDLLKE